MPVTLVLGTNTYVLLQEIEDFFSGEIDNEEWLALPEEEKSKFVVYATHLIDDQLSPFISKAASLDQELAFPRESFSFIDPVLGVKVSFESDEYPPRLKKAVFYTVQHLLRYRGNLFEGPSDQEWSRVELDGFKIERAETDQKTNLDRQREQLIPSSVYRLMRPLRRKQDNLWFRVN